MNICGDGAFRLATGILYQSKKSPSVQIGASDGLAIYRGTWAMSAFPFTNGDGKKFVLKFANAARYEKQLIDEWVGCEPRKPPPPPPAPRRSGGDRGNRAQSRRRSSVPSPNDSR